MQGHVIVSLLGRKSIIADGRSEEGFLRSRLETPWRKKKLRTPDVCVLAMCSATPGQTSWSRVGSDYVLARGTTLPVITTQSVRTATMRVAVDRHGSAQTSPPSFSPPRWRTARLFAKEFV